ncbi:Fe-S-containing protein [Candidatus Binatus sp.]|uniref:Fe-S-containing protein n=1 Tax=Candidatus Binatus sp. TaxID=2811406 RepID=UPI002F947C49
MAFSIARFRGRSALLIAAAGLVAVAVSWSMMARAPEFSPVSANPSISIETDNLRRGDVRFFTYRDRAGDQIRFLLARDSTGRIEGAIDACRRCSMYRKGYVSSRGDLVCRYCGNRYKLEAMESGLASCVPVKLPFQVTGHTVNIKPADLQRERGLF